MSNHIQTKEFLDFLFAVVRQGMDSFKDGAQLTDAPDFIDEATQLPQALDGFVPNFLPEAGRATPESVDELFKNYQQILIGEGMKPMLAFTIINSMKTIYGTIAISQASKT